MRGALNPLLEVLLSTEKAQILNLGSPLQCLVLRWLCCRPDRGWSSLTAEYISQARVVWDCCSSLRGVTQLWTGCATYWLEWFICVSGAVRKHKWVGELKLSSKVFQLMSYWVAFKVKNAGARVFWLLDVEANYDTEGPSPVKNTLALAIQDWSDV